MVFQFGLYGRALHIRDADFRRGVRMGASALLTRMAAIWAASAMPFCTGDGTGPGSTTTETMIGKREIRSAFAFVENSPLLASRGLEHVLSSLAEMGYDAKWCVLGAGHLDYPIKRDRLWILGRRNPVDGQGYVSWLPERPDRQYALWREEKLSSLQSADRDRLLADGLLCRTPDGVANRMDRIESLGNGQVPDVAALAWEVLSGAFKL